MKSFSRKLSEWYDPDTRNLPWKKTKDAYKIWLSEIILQQTRVEQGKPYYLAFIKKYPTVRKLASAPLDEVLKLWEGLGYYSRARNLHSAARQIVDEHNGKFPSGYQAILDLKGIGKYTAAAIASFAYGLPHAVVDGNVYRVLSRVFGIETTIDTTPGKQQFEALADKLLDRKNPALHNQALMDFGALICKPQQPLCGQCPFSSECRALASDAIRLLPVKSKKLFKKDRHFHYFVLHDAKNIFIRQRTDQDIWKGLFEFPMEESAKPADHSPQFPSNSVLKKYVGLSTVDHRPTFTYRQTLSHQHINAYFCEIRLNKLPKPDESYLRIAKNPYLSTLIQKIIRSYLADRLNFLS
ncbi:MAG: A/G-specific adenine glycosylase [Sphingobacteriales bacterium]|nr:A/G-specific adenine glycosylase [Sphingobacteriales bacterium]